VVAIAAVAVLGGHASAAENVHDGLADPSTVAPGETVQPHEFSFAVDNVSNDGSSDELFVTFPDEVPKEKLSSYSGDVTDAETGASVSVSSSLSIVDGPDGDGVQETLKIGVQPEGEQATRDLVVNFTSGQATWPTVDETRQFPIRASVIDSGGPNVDLVEFATVTVEAGTSDEGTTTEDSDPSLAVRSATAVGETAATLEAEVTDLGGADGASIWFAYWEAGERASTESTTSKRTVSSTGDVAVDVSGLEADTEYVYEAHVEASDGDTAHSQTASFATDAPTPHKQIRSGTAQPAVVEGGESVQHRFAYEVTGVSNDGTSVELFLTAPGGVTSDELSSFSGEVSEVGTGNPVSIASSPSIVDGPDGDGVQDTVKIGVQPSGDAEIVDLRVVFTGEITWPRFSSTLDLEMQAAVIDHSGSDVAGGVPFATVTVEAAQTDQGSEEPTQDGSEEPAVPEGPTWTFGLGSDQPVEECPVTGCHPMSVDEIDPDGGVVDVNEGETVAWAATQPAGETYEPGSKPWVLRLHCTEQTQGTFAVALGVVTADQTSVPDPAARTEVSTERCEGEDSDVLVQLEPDGSFELGEDEQPAVWVTGQDAVQVSIHAKPDGPDTQLLGPASVSGYASAGQQMPVPAWTALLGIAAASAILGRRR